MNGTSTPAGTPRPDDYLRKHLDFFERQAGDAANLVAALQVVLWELAQQQLDGWPNEQRNALIGIGDALDAVMKRDNP